MEYYNPENREPVRWATVAVLIYIALLFLLLFTIRFRLLETDPADQGILVDFGETLEGWGEEELLATDVAATPPAPQENTEEQPLDVDERSDVEIAQNDTEQKPSPSESLIEQPVEQRDTVIVEERVVNQNALFPGRQEQSTSTSQGSVEATQGNQGEQSGDEGSAANGGGVGDSPIFDLKDRSAVGSLPKPSYGVNASGKVVIDITVDDSGRVTSATYRAQGSTTNNSQMVAAARAAALKARFTTSDNFIQAGTITYNFKLD